MFLKIIISLCLFHIYRVVGVDCNTTQVRPDDSPSGTDIKNAIINDSLNLSICSGRFPSNSPTEADWNHGGLVLTVSRARPNTTLHHCNEAFTNIIEECIVGQNYFGGSWSISGESYTISNQQYPNNPLLPQDHGGPSSSQGSISSSQAASTSSDTTSSSEVTSERAPTSSQSSSSFSTGSSSGLPSPTQTTTSDSGVLSSSSRDAYSSSSGQSMTSHSSVADETVITEVIDGSSITATFDLTSLTRYEDLSSTITTTTEQDGTKVTFIIFPGGLAWINVGGAPAGVIPTPPPGPPPPNGGGNNPDPTTKDDPTSVTEESTTSDTASSSFLSSSSSSSSSTFSFSSTSSSACDLGTISPGFPWQFGDDGPIPPSYTDSGPTTSNSVPVSLTSGIKGSSTSELSHPSQSVSSVSSTNTASSTITSSSDTPSPSPSEMPSQTTTQLPTSTSDIAPSCRTVTSAGAVCTLCEDSVDPACDAIGPPAPTQTASNKKGSALCKSAISGDDCRRAYRRYDVNRIYNAYTSYTFTNYGDPINALLPADDGCTAMFKCDSDEAYAAGMAGWAIVAAFDYMYANDGVKTCGSAYLDNGCHITANACSGCKDVNT